jgi:nicotinate-nucleotide--dimethylbenzimidazole phosphoribosyltransferase
MTVELATKAVLAGAEIVDELDAVDAIGLGEMGIGNTTSASALVAALLGVEPELVCGRGTGLDDAGVARKAETVAHALEVNGVDPADPLAVLAALGGFEIAVLVGVALGCAANRVVCVLDGFITGAAALVAARIAPASVGAMIAAHRSTEPGHRIVLDALGLEPVLDLGLRLGEGSGAALALPVLRAAVAIANEMATFADAGVTDAGR